MEGLIYMGSMDLTRVHMIMRVAMCRSALRTSFQSTAASRTGSLHTTFGTR